MSRRIRVRTPAPVLALGVLAVAMVALPLVGLAVAMPWGRIPELLGEPIVLDALRLSLLTSLLATVICVVLGVPLAWLLARVPFRGRTVVRAIVTLPMVLPPVVGGAALLFAFGRRGVFGEPVADATGFVLPFSIWAVVLANVFVALPFLVVTVEGALVGADERIEQAAASLGAGPLRVIIRVALPAIAPSLRAGALLAWARSLGEFGATITFAGNLQGRTQTLPLAVFVALESDRDAALVISLVLIVISLVLLVSLRGRWWGTR